MSPVAVLDTSVLFAPTLRDTLLRCAELDLYIPRWSPDVMRELRGALIQDAGLPAQSVDRLIQLMNSQFPAASIEGYQTLVDQMTNHPKDRHVLAAAVHAGADTLVTLNLRDFLPAHAAPYGIVIQSPDDFLMGLATASPASMGTVVSRQAKARRRPPTTVPELLTRLEGKVPTFARFMEVQMREENS